MIHVAKLQHLQHKRELKYNCQPHGMFKFPVFRWHRVVPELKYGYQSLRPGRTNSLDLQIRYCQSFLCEVRCLLEVQVLWDVMLCSGYLVPDSGWAAWPWTWGRYDHSECVAVYPSTEHNIPEDSSLHALPGLKIEMYNQTRQWMDRESQPIHHLFKLFLKKVWKRVMSSLSFTCV